MVGEGILINILLHVPPKSVIRFKSASKWWNALINGLINDPNFVVKYLSNSNSAHKQNSLSSPSLLLKRTVPNAITNEKESLFSLHDSCNNNGDNDEHNFLSDGEEFNIPHSMRLLTKGASLRVVGQCNGIICLAIAKNYDHVFLWNPTFRHDYKLLPPEPLLPNWPTQYKKFGSRQDAPYTRGYRIQDAMGFGYDPKSNDYKVIDIGFSGSKIVPIFDSGILGLTTCPPKALVYNLGTDSWRDVDTSGLESETKYVWPERFQMYSKGICYWLGRQQYKQVPPILETSIARRMYGVIEIKQVISAFDTCSEEFHQLALPDELYGCAYVGDRDRGEPLYEHIGLTVWNESTALFAIMNDKSTLEIWVMEDHDFDGGAKGISTPIWTKHLSVDHGLIKYCYALSFWSMGVAFWGDRIVMCDGDASIVCYSVHTQSFNRFPMQSSMRDFAAITYIKTLAPVKGVH